MRETVVHEHHGGSICSAATVCLLGDLMTGRGIDQILAHPGEPRLYESHIDDARAYVHLAERGRGRLPRHTNPSSLWGAALEELDRYAPDATIANLETSITHARTPWPHKGIHYKMAPENIACLQRLGLDCVSLANNHVMDWGREGLSQTLHTLQHAGLRYAGAGESLSAAAVPVAIPIEAHVRLLVFAFGTEDSGIPRAWAATRDQGGVNLLEKLDTQTAQRVAEQIHSQRHPGDIVVVSIHWGDNWGYRIPESHRRFAHALIDKGGVDLIHGHSSHHVRPLEVYKGQLILYGCGDFINDYEGIGGREQYRGDLTLMYFVSLSPRSGEVLQLRMRPLRIREMRLSRATESDARFLADTLNRESPFLEAAVEVDQDNTLLLQPV